MDRYIGKLLDNRYEILEVIGTGGMAVVYKARCRLLNRFVAIKILKDEYAKDADFRRRFHTESQAVAMLSHPNIVSVYDVNRSDNIEYIVMELVEGITLKEYMQRKGALSSQEIIHFAPQIVRALEHAHGRGIIHRDIKPQNIIILRDGSLKVTDFGIARFAQSKQQTLTDEALGSVHYVSPEQARGSNIDARSDIYSFGVVMYEMLTGRLPFEGETPVAVVLQHINSIPLLPHEINVHIPAALEAITMKAMNPAVESRYASATDVLFDLELYKKDPYVVFDYLEDYCRVNEISERVVRKTDDTVKFTPVVPSAPPRSGQRAPRESRANTGGGSAPADEETDSIPAQRSAQRKRTKSRPAPQARPHDDDDYDNRPRTPVLLYLITGVITAAIFFGGAAFIFNTLFGAGGESDAQDVTVPNLVGKFYDDVRASSQYSELNIMKGEEVYSPTVEAGKIIETKPEAGRTIKKDAEIYATVSLGAKKAKVPDVINMEYRSAQLAVTAQNLLYKLEYKLSDTIVEGNVIETVPTVNTELEENGIVTLYISLGREKKYTKVPDILGMTEAQARRALEKDELRLGEVIPVESDKPEGEVVYQSVDPDTEIEEKTAIDVHISQGKDDEPTTAPTKPDDGKTSAAPQGKYDVLVRLPNDDRDSVTVVIKASNNILHEQSYKNDKETVTIPVYGSGSALIQVFIDGVKTGEEIAIFGE